LTLTEASALARHTNPRITASDYARLAVGARKALGDKLAVAFER
jgi:hypothetical protein